MKQLEVTILGQSYLLGCPEGGETGLLEAVAMVDREMGAIRDSGKVRARERIAVLAALNLAYALAGKGARRLPGTGTPAEGKAGPLPAEALAEADVVNLITRLDQALGADGRLL